MMMARSVGLGIALAGVLAAAGSAEEGFVKGADDVRLFHRVLGRGRDTLVFLHGGPGSNFRGSGTELEGLARGRRFVLYDQRGSGRSEIVKDPARLTASHHVRDLEALRQHLGSETISLVGLSWGAGLAALYADAHPTRVARLVLISPMSPTKRLFEERRVALAAVRGVPATARFKEILDGIARAGDPETVALCRESIDLGFPAYLVRPARAALDKAAQRCDIPPAAIRNRPVVEAAGLASLGDWDLRPVLARLQVPALVMEGAQTQVPLDATREWARAIPRATLVLVPDAGHEIFLDQRDAVVEAADRFLGGRDPASGQGPPIP